MRMCTLFLKIGEVEISEWYGWNDDWTRPRQFRFNINCTLFHEHSIHGARVLEITA